MNDDKCDFFYDIIFSLGGLTQIDKKMHKAICDLDKTLSIDVKIVLYIFLCFLNDGNIFITLNQDSSVLKNKWIQKYNSLLAQADIKTTNTKFYKSNFINESLQYIENGLNDILNYKKNNYCIFEEVTEVELKSNYNSESIQNAKTPFIISQDKNGIKKLYTKKHFIAKCKIESALNKFFDISSTEKIEKSQIEKTIQEANKVIDKYKINDEQATAIIKGQIYNLIITGGPGTGKTTVILFLLWFLLQTDGDKINHIFLAAPSGKAADRMSESLKNNLNDITDFIKNGDEKNRSIYERLCKICDDGGQTIHKLLSYNPMLNGFKYTEKNKFPKKSLFVIDEASMIDVTLFASFLEALPDDARLFILGDPFQLPSVEAGAVLENILRLKSDFNVELILSNRFDDKSQIGNLAKKIRTMATKVLNDESCKNDKAEPIVPKDEFGLFEKLKTNLIDESKINFISINEEDSKNQIEQILLTWSEYFCQKLFLFAEKIKPENFSNTNEEKELCQKLWDLSLQFRILAAEKNGMRGVEYINDFVCQVMRQNDSSLQFEYDKYFPGQLLIVTKNQKLYKLNNGDTGIVVFSNSNCDSANANSTEQTKTQNTKRRPYVLFKKATGFEFYPLSSLPTDSIQTAFAITIHKSQGSEYSHILMFLPKQREHPLSTNQIVYTGLTRAKKSVSIVSSFDAFDNACKKLIVRDTGLEILI